MSRLLYQVINPVVSCLLRSPLHGAMSSNTLLLEFTGRKSGRDLSTPISYYLESDTAHAMTSKSFAWWRNLTTGKPVRLTIKGQRWQSTPVVESGDAAVVAKGLTAFLKAVPRDASHAGVGLDADGEPVAQDVLRVAPDMVHLKFPLEKIHE